MKTVKYIKSFLNFRSFLVLLCVTEIFHPNSLCSHPMFLSPTRRNLSFCLFLTLLVASLHRQRAERHHRPTCSLSISLSCLVSTAFKASYCLCCCVPAQWMIGPSGQIISVLAISVSGLGPQLDQKKSTVLENSCSANTESREFEIFLDIFTVDLRNTTSLGLVTWCDLEEMAKSHLFNRACGPSKDQVTFPKAVAKRELLKRVNSTSRGCMRGRIHTPYDN